MEIKIRLPQIAPGAVSNLVGLLGLVAMVVAVGGLTGNIWWAVLCGGVFAVALAALAQASDQEARRSPPVAVPTRSSLMDTAAKAS